MNVCKAFSGKGVFILGFFSTWATLEENSEDGFFGVGDVFVIFSLMCKV